MLIPQPIRPVPNDLDRCWMFDDYFDLIVWFTPEREIDGFQLCYDKPRKERALTWRRACGFSHDIIDEGESHPCANATPILQAGGEFPVEKVRSEFATRSRLIDRDIRSLVLRQIEQFAGIHSEFC